MLEEIIEYLKEHPEGVSSTELAQKFLKIQNPQSSFAHLTVRSILSKNSKCYIDKSDMWHVQSILASDKSLNKLPLTAVFLIGSSSGTSDRQIYYIALWKINPEVQYLWGGWNIELESVQQNNLQNLASIYDVSLLTLGKKESIAQALQSSIPVFANLNEYNLFRAECLSQEIDLTDDTIHICDLLDATGIVVNGLGNVSTLSKALLGNTADFMSAYKQGQVFAECVRELVQKLSEKGIDSRLELDNALKSSRSIPIKGKMFTYDQICALPETHGVFALKNKDEQYLYIGKSDNLKRKFQSFLRYPQENPAKLKQLLEQAYSLITHQSASGLEALLYEYRLINKYAPLLNQKINSNHVAASNDPMEDCVVVMPHINNELVMTFWFKKNQKIKIRSLNLNSDNTFVSEIESYFSQKNQVETVDSVEINLSHKWVLQNRDKIILVPAKNGISGSEILSEIKFLWKNRLFGD